MLDLDGTEVRGTLFVDHYRQPPNGQANIKLELDLRRGLLADSEPCQLNFDLEVAEEEALEELEVQQMGAHVVRKLTKSAHYFRRQELNQNQLVITMRSGLH